MDMPKSGSMPAPNEGSGSTGTGGAEAAGQPFWDVFISYATEDKEEVSEPLANALKGLGISVWYDKFELRGGDSLLKRIDEGIKRSRFGLVVLSNSFFGKGWPEYELEGLATLAISGELKLIPIWHEISEREVREYSPTLANRVGLLTAKLGIDKIAEQIAQRIAESGVDDVATSFTQISWNPPRVQPQRPGSDLWVRARDIDGSELSCFVGMQVRTGDQFFGSFAYKDGAAGFWYDGMDANHVEHWFQDRDPHLLVLHDHHTKESYWERVNRDTAEWTGGSYKIFVPESQTVGETGLASLIKAVRAEPETSRDIERIEPPEADRSDGPERRLRFALVAPRLVASHRLGEPGGPISAEQGVALLAQGRFRDLKRIADENEDVPDPEQMPEDADWGWHFAAAFWEWATTDDTGRLRSVFDSAPDASRKAAAGVLLSCALRRASQTNEALAVLDSLLEDDLESADQGWAFLQRARTRAEAGDDEGSRSDAEDALEVLDGLDDETAKAFDAAARWHLFSLDPLGAAYGRAMEAPDNEAQRWRTAEVSAALSEAQDNQFRSWAEPDSIVVFGQERAPLGLFAAELNADLAGGHGDWKARAATWGRHRLMRAADSRDEQNELFEGLELLRICGDSRSLESAANRIHRAGPIGALAEAVDRVPVGRWTRTTAQGNLQLLAVAGDLLDAGKATELLRWCAQLAGGDTAAFSEQVRPWFWVEYFAVQAIAGLLPAADDSAHSETAELLSQRIDPDTNIPDTDIAGVFEQLDHDRVSPAARESLWGLAQNNRGPLGASALEWLAANRHAQAQAEAINGAASQDLKALPAMLASDPSLVDDNTARLLIEWFEDMAERQLSSARNGSYTLGGYDGALLLAEFNLHFTELGKWDTIIEVLSDPRQDAHSKRNICARLAVRAAKMPSGVRTEIAQSIDAIAQAASAFGEEPGVGGIHTMLRIGLEIVGGDQAAAEAAELAFGSQRDREDAALLLGSGQCPENQPILAALAADQSFSVRRTAAVATGKLVSTSPNPLNSALARRLAEDKGSDLPAALLSGILQAGEQTTEGAEIAQQLRRHPSARIRRMADRIP